MLASAWTRRFPSCKLLSPIFALTLFAVAASAQTSQISGSVDDASKARIQGAAISLTHTETGERREVTSNADGYFVFPILQAGHYEVRVEKRGFETQIRSGLQVLTWQTTVNAIEEIEVEGEAEVRRDTEQRALQFLQDKQSKLAWDEMQELVAGLLRSMGYKTRVSPAGPDRGRDIIAFPVGFQPPRIVVEVKHRKAAMGAPAVRSFVGGLRRNYNGLYVSTGGFTREARYEADRTN